MARKKNRIDPQAKRADETDLQWRSRLARQREVAEAKKRGPTPEAVAHGDYVEATVLDPSGETRNLAKVSINRGGTPVARWQAQKRLSDTQELAIAYCLRLWEIAGYKVRVTASYGEKLAGSGDADRRATCEIDARAGLHRIQDYIPKPYWSVFEAVVRFDEPAGVAGSSLANSTRNAKHTAYLAVCFVADLIAMKERL